MMNRTPRNASTSARSRRRTFGDDAEEYDAFRPGYPAQLVDDVLDFAGLDDGVPAVEVGAGTGKATRAFGQSGLPVTCVEPDARMARVLRHHCGGLPHVTVEIAEFETWRPARRYGLLYCAQAWHWVDPAVRWARAKDALSPGGAIALFWNHWFLESDELTAELTTAHARHGIEIPEHTILDPRPGPARYGADARQWRDMVAAGFVDPDHRMYESVHDRSPSALVGLLASYSGYRVLPPRARERIFADMAHTVAEQGGSVRVKVKTSLFLGRASDD
ncbi:class I SAM-dependent methyltransferase [Streptomyces violascens]|uniref:Methyltransferase type 11 n=1 Tax=Streptomyces violascens TaxID=67381 RepID=A0ABQ3QTT1_9ACTN|nr:methyltransferase domain-containing protein [Streptomyces violascens]GHI40692.1 methyltransferase type 11 [Streptomyces violascens]